MTRHRIVITSSGSIDIYRGWRVADLLRDGGFRPVFAASAGGWMLDAQRLADVLAYLDQRNIAVELDQERTSSTPAVDDRPVTEESLW